MTAARILLVDDNPMNLAVLEELLSDDYETVSAESGEEACAVTCLFDLNVERLLSGSRH